VKILECIVRMGCVLALLGPARTAFAQDPAGQPGPGAPPARPLFGGGPGLIDQSLTAGLSFGAGYDIERAKPESVPAGVDPAIFIASGQNVFAHGTLGYSAGFGRVTGGATLRSAAFYYNRATSDLRVHSGASLHADVKLWRDSRVGVRHDITYAPIQFHLQSVAEQLDPQGNPYFDPDLVGKAVTTHRTSLDFGQPLSLSFSRRLALDLGYSFQAGDRRVFGQASHAARAGLAYQIGRGLGLRAGYQLAFARFRTSENDSEWVKYHSFDGGLNFNKRLSLLRRLTLSFGTGVAAIRNPNATHYTMIGGARLNWNISRSWNAGVGFNRDVQFVDEFQNVAVGNRVNASLHGSLTERVSFRSTVGTWFFDVAGGSSDSRVQTIFGNVGVSTALTRFLALGADYSNSYHSVGSGVVLFPGVPRERNRHGIRVHLSLFAPLYGTTRRQQ
jgi:hypothetical protein